MAGCYIHIPFCRRKCHYCDFYSVAATHRKAEVLQAIRRELAARRDYLDGAPVRTLYFGGGTPSLLTAGEVSDLVEAIKDTFPTDLQEVTIEANPDDVTESLLEGWRESGIDRISLGVQSFSDRTLSFFNRRHDGRKAREAVRMAQAAGFENLSIDLIYGVPGMTAGEWKSTLSDFLETDVPHLSAYHLTLEPGTPFGRRAEKGELVPVPDQTSREHYALLESMTRDAGYQHYEVSAFARQGYRSVHNGNYWKGIPYIGAGPGAHSYDGRERRWNFSSIERYLAGGGYYGSELLTEADRYHEFVMTSLRTSDGFLWAEARKRFSDPLLEHLRREVRGAVRRGLLLDDGIRVRMETRHFLISDHIIGALFLG